MALPNPFHPFLSRQTDNVIVFDDLLAMHHGWVTPCPSFDTICSQVLTVIIKIMRSLRSDQTVIVPRIALNRNRRGEAKFDKICSHHGLVMFGSALHLGRCNGSRTGCMTTFQMFPIVSIGFQGPAATWMPCWPVTIAKTGAGSFEIQSQREAFDLWSDVKWAKGAINCGWTRWTRWTVGNYKVRRISWAQHLDNAVI